MVKIEDCENPIFGESYLVRTVKFIRNFRVLEWPVTDKEHEDRIEDNFLEESHYHIDWRFMPNSFLFEHREHNQKLSIKWKYTNAEYVSPILKSEVIEESYKCWIYKRDHSELKVGNNKLFERLKGARMRNFVCPHQGTNLKSCRIRNKSIQCPNHGLIWSVETGNLIKDYE